VNAWTLVRRSLRHYWRTHLGVLAGMAVGSAILIGSLAVGDSMRYSLGRMASWRLGKVHYVLGSEGRLFRAALADDPAGELGAPAAPVLSMAGVATNAARTARANDVRVLGVDGRFWPLGAAGAAPAEAGDGEVILNRRLARQLGARAGDRVQLTLPRPLALPGDAPLAMEKDLAVTLTVAAVASDEQFGRYDLQGSQVPPYNAFAPRRWLGRLVGLEGLANVLLVGDAPDGPVEIARAERALRRSWRLADAQLELRPAAVGQGVELRSDRVFLDDPVVAAAAAAAPNALGILTYFVTAFEHDGNSAPYSTVSAVGRIGRDGGAPPRPLPALADGEIALNAWLADDLGAGVGDRIALSYYAVDAGKRLVQRRASLRVAAVVPIEHLAADRTLMPEVPGLAEADDPRDWRLGFRVDYGRIRPKDDRYWQQRRGTPKAFVSLATGQALWASRYGRLTAVRFPAAAGGRRQIARALRSRLDPAAVGLHFRDARRRAEAASRGAADFGALFVGFSFFLLVASLLLMGLLFAFGAEQRSEQAGTLLALGLRPRRVRAVLLLEGAVVAAAGTAAGAVLGWAYAAGMLRVMTSLWRQAVRTSLLQFHVAPRTLAVGMAASLAAALGVMWLVLRWLGRMTPRELLGLGQGAAEAPGVGPPRGVRAAVAAAVVLVGGALAAVVTAEAGQGRRAAGVFFAAGTALLAGGLAAAYAVVVSRRGGAADAPLTLARLGARNAARRAGRSLAVVALLACGAFLVVAVGANRRDPSREAGRRRAGTGGFALYGESALPIFHDLVSPAGRHAHGLGAEEMAGVRVVSLRVAAGEDASCLNLNRAQRPRLLGVRPAELARRGAFRFLETLDAVSGADGWGVLDANLPGGAVPAVADEPTIVWGLGKALGDVIEYTDERGRRFDVKLVGMIGGSILQGSLVVSQRALLERFPSTAGFRAFLADAPSGRAPAVAEALTEALARYGPEFRPAARRLAEFTAVENAYIAIFQALGGLGLVLGSCGLGLVVLRNVLQRRGELAALRAVGFSRRALRRLVLWEHWLLLGLGLACGSVAGALAVVPALRSPGARVPCLSLGLTMAAVAAAGVLWTRLAAGAALRGPLLDALRDE
jgi:hypothetical protein